MARTPGGRRRRGDDLPAVACAFDDLTAFVSEVRGGEFDGLEAFGVQVADGGRPVVRLVLTRAAAGKLIGLATAFLVRDGLGSDDDEDEGDAP